MAAHDAAPKGCSTLGRGLIEQGQPNHSTVSRVLTGARCRCGACGDLFNAVSTFDAHRVGAYDARRCLSTDEMTARGWLRNVAGFWITSRMPPGRLNRAATSGDRHMPATQVGGAS
ncbi:MAG: hypothetical protein IT519_14135 [Burkholderiales bacterium]|nr:hypothetical protein [Burkholderiales bacterium]